MRIVRERIKEKLRPLNIQIRPSVIERVDKEAIKAGISRQKFIEAILDQVLSDKDFVLKIRD